MAMLLEPVTFRSGAVAPNRIALAPLTNGQSQPDGSLGDDELSWLGRRADGGFGIVETCAAHVSQDGKAWDGELGVHDDAMLPGLRRLAARCAVAGGLPLVQLFHGGVRAPSKVSGSQPWSASSWHEDTPDFETPRAGSEADIQGAIAAFAAAARRVASAGFAGVEIHGAHGYLLGQFLSRTMNQRSDAWGGELAGRARLMREVVRAVRAAVPAPFVVGVRISPEDFGNARGLDLDENLQLGRWLCEDGIDFLHLSLWKSADNTRKRPGMVTCEVRRAPFVPSGSFTTWTMMSWPSFTSSSILASVPFWASPRSARPRPRPRPPPPPKASFAATSAAPLPMAPDSAGTAAGSSSSSSPLRRSNSSIVLTTSAT